MRIAQHLLRPILLVAGLAVLGAVPVALAVTADPFGAPEIADPMWHPGTFYLSEATYFSADGDGNVLLGTFFRDAKGDDQVAVYDRCGSGPATWQRTVVTAVTGGVEPMGVRVARNGTAMAVWRVAGGGTVRHFSSVRPPGGAWGAPEPIVVDPEVNYVQFALSDTGEAVVSWVDTNPAGTWASIRPAGGTWGAPEKIVDTARDFDVAMSGTGDAVVLVRGAYPGPLRASHRPAGGAWGAAQTVIQNSYPDTLKAMQVEFDGLGRPVALANFRELNDTIRVNVRTGGAWGPVDQVIDDDGDNPPNPSFDVRGLYALVRHPQGAVAVWSRRSTSSNFNDDLVVSRLSGGGWETTPTIFNLPNRFTSASVATNDTGEVLLAASLAYGASDVVDVRSAIAPSLTAPWPAMSLLSPQANPTNQYRDAIAAGGGSAFYVGWGVHGGSNQRTEVVSTRPAGATCGATPTPTPTPAATATASPSPDPLPATPSPTPTPTAVPQAKPPATPAPPTAIADFTTLPSAKTCIRNHKLTVRFKKPPKGYVVKTVTVKVNQKRVATLKGAKLKQPLYLRKLPKGTFTITVSIKLTKGKGLTERRRYTACK